MTLKAIAGRQIEAGDHTAEVVAMLRELSDRVEQGELEATQAMVYLQDDSATDDFTFSLHYKGRATRMLAGCKIAETVLLKDIGIIDDS